MLPFENIRFEKTLLGNLLRAAREEEFLTVRDVASAAGLDSSHISKIELAKVNVSAENLVRICCALSLPPGVVLESCIFASRVSFQPGIFNNEALKILPTRKECTDFLSGTALAVSYVVKSSDPTGLIDRLDFPVSGQREEFEKFAATIGMSTGPAKRRAIMRNLIIEGFQTLKELGVVRDGFIEEYLAQWKLRSPISGRPWIPLPKPVFFAEEIKQLDLESDVGVLIAEGKRRRKGIPQKADLTNSYESVNIKSVKPQLPSLLIRLKALTELRGKKSELAKYLGFPLVRVSQWLSGDREPGGETTLRLLRWVKAEEVNQNENPERVSARPGRKTRSMLNPNENTKSNPRKK